MATEILAVGTSTASSNDVVIAAGAQLTVCLKDAAGAEVSPDANVLIRLKDDASQYFNVAALTGSKPVLVIAGAGTYQFTRVGGVSCGVFSG